MPITRHRARRWPAPPAMLAVAALALLPGATPANADAPAATPADRFVTTQLPDSPAGHQLAWFIEASRRLPLGEAELRAHFTKAFLASPGGSPKEVNDVLSQGIDASGVTLLGLTLAQPDRLIAIVTGRGGLELRVVLTTNTTGLIEFALLQPVSAQAAVTLPTPSGSRTVGTDVVALVDHARTGRRLMLTRWYPAATKGPNRPSATYAGPLLSSALGLPNVRVHAHLGAMPRGGRLPTVLFSPGFGTPASSIKRSRRISPATAISSSPSTTPARRWLSSPTAASTSPLRSPAIRSPRPARPGWRTCDSSYAG
jgi:hypothetical protein